MAKLMNRPSYQAKKEVSSKPALLQAMIDAFRVPDLRFRILFTFPCFITFGQKLKNAKWYGMLFLHP